MPKTKSHRGAAKRFKVLPSGRIRRRKAFANHNLEKKKSNRKRRLTAPADVSKADTKRIRSLMK
jgi:large subunit ribosomal protein L35